MKLSTAKDEQVTGDFCLEKADVVVNDNLLLSGTDLPKSYYTSSFKLTNHDIAYHMGMMDSLTILFERERQNENVNGSASEEIEVPKALYVALDARKRYINGNGDFRDSSKAATMAQRAVDDISYHAGSLPDVVVYTIEDPNNQKNRWTWAPAFTISVTHRSKNPPPNRVYDTQIEAQQAADKFASKVLEVSRWADTGVRRTLQAWIQQRQIAWSNIEKGGALHMELSPMSIGNFMVIYCKISITEPEIAIDTMSYIVHNIDIKDANLIHLGTVECSANFIVMYGVLAIKNGKDTTKIRQSLKRNEIWKLPS
jgi:hypothetical protein